jgi:hypothetical protein
MILICMPSQSLGMLASLSAARRHKRNSEVRLRGITATCFRCKRCQHVTVNESDLKPERNPDAPGMQVAAIRAAGSLAAAIPSTEFLGARSRVARMKLAAPALARFGRFVGRWWFPAVFTLKADAGGRIPVAQPDEHRVTRPTFRTDRALVSAKRNDVGHLVSYRPAPTGR